MPIQLMLVLVAVTFQMCLCKPVEQLSNLGQSSKNVAQEVSNTLGLQDVTSENVLKAINDQSKAFADNLNVFVDKLKNEYSAIEDEVVNVIENVENKLTNTVSDLMGSLLKTQQQYEEKRRKFNEGLKNAANELSNFVKSIQEDKQVQQAQSCLNNLGKSLLDRFVESVRNVKDQLYEAVADHEKNS